MEDALSTLKDEVVEEDVKEEDHLFIANCVTVLDIMQPRVIIALTYSLNLQHMVEHHHLQAPLSYQKIM